MSILTDKGPIRFIIILILIALFNYLHTLGNAFHFDDIHVKNILSHISDSADNNIFKILKKSAVPNRPVANLTFIANYYLDGMNPAGFHIVNIAIHILTGILIYLILIKTLGYTNSYRKHRMPLSAAAALIWIVHPVNIQAVTYIVQRMTSMAAMFYLLSLLLYLSSRESKDKSVILYTLSIISWLFAMGCKEISAMLPFMIFLYELLFFGTGKKRAFRILALWLIPVLISGFLYVGGVNGLIGIFKNLSENAFQNRDFTVSERLMTQPRVILYYIMLLLLPLSSRLTLDYDFIVSKGIFTPPTAFLSVLVLIAIVYYGVISMDKRKIAAFSIIWFISNLLIESSIFNLEMIYEHRVYIPGIGAIVLFIVTMFELTLHLYKRVKSYEVKKGFTITILLLVMVFSFFTIKRNFAWKTGITLWSLDMKNYPYDSRVRYNLGNAYKEINQYNNAIDQYKMAVLLDPKDIDAYNNMIVMYGKQKEIVRAIDSFKKAIKLGDKFPKIYFNMGLAYYFSDNKRKAVTMFQKALDYKDDFKEAYKMIGEIQLDKYNIELSINNYEKAFEYDKDDVEVIMGLATAYVYGGKIDKGIGLYQKVFRQDKENKIVYKKLATAYEKKGDISNFLKYIKKYISLNPEDSKAYSEVGVVLLKYRKLKKAEKFFKIALAKDKGDKNAISNLAYLAMENKDYDIALRLYRELIKLDENNFLAYYNLSSIYLLKKMDKKVIEINQKILDMQEGFTKSYIRLAYVYKDINLEKARYYLSEAAKGKRLDPWMKKRILILEKQLKKSRGF